MKKLKILFFIIFILLIAAAALFYYSSIGNNVFITEYKNKNKQIQEITSNTSSSKNINSNLQIQKWFTSNNIPVYFIAAPELPILDIQVTINAGSAHIPQKPGVAHLTSKLLFKGTKKYSTEEINENLENVGAIYNASVNKDHASLYLRSLTDSDKLEPALELFVDTLTKSIFPKKEFARIKDKAIEYLKLNQQYPDYISDKTFYKAVYKNHPYADATSGDISDVKKISRKDLIRFYNEFYVAENMQIAMVGQSDINKAKKIAEKIATNITSGEKAKPISEPSILNYNERKHINFPSAQTHIILGTTAIKRNDPDYFALTLGNHILGRMPLVSILFTQVRKKNGLAYSVYSNLNTMKMAGPFYIEMQTRNEKVKEALDISKQTLNDFLELGPTDSELYMGKLNLTGMFPLGIASNKQKLAVINNIGFYDLPLDYMDTYINNINKINKDDIIKAFNKHIKSNNLAIVTVGASPDKS